jgi:translin
MQDLESISERIRQSFDARTRARDQALGQTRLLTRHAAHAIRAIHRNEHSLAQEHLGEALKLVEAIKAGLADFPDLYHAGYTQDALKEFSEASITVALIENRLLPGPEELDVEYATYLNGLAEVTGELRRRCLDILRQGYSAEAERLLSCMDDIYAVLVTLDYPDAITNGLRRQTDLVRGIVERTRGDLTISLREQQLEQSMAHLSALLSSRDAPKAGPHADDPSL